MRNRRQQHRRSNHSLGAEMMRAVSGTQPRSAAWEQAIALELLVDPQRQYDIEWRRWTGQYVHAYGVDGWGVFDVAQLTAESLLRWLRLGGQVNPVAENLVGVLLHHNKPLVGD